MTLANTPQGTGAMTLEQGVASMKAKLAETGANVDDTAIVHADDPNEEEFGDAIEEEETELAEETPEGVSEDESEAEEEPDERPIILPDGAQITVEEARKGYLRQSAFTQKTQALAQEREQIFAERAAAIQQVQGLYQNLVSLQETEPDWLQLAQDPNVDSKQLQAAQAFWQSKKNAMTRAQQMIQQQQAATKQVALTKAIETLKSGEYDPAWKDEKVLSGALEQVTNYVAENYPGIPQELMGEVVWPEAIIMMDKARRWDDLQKAKPKAAKAVRGKPLPFKPGAKSTATPQSENIRLLEETFRANPSVDNAVALQRAKAGRR